MKQIAILGLSALALAGCETTYESLFDAGAAGATFSSSGIKTSLNGAAATIDYDAEISIQVIHGDPNEFEVVVTVDDETYTLDEANIYSANELRLSLPGGGLLLVFMTEGWADFRNGTIEISDVAAIEILITGVIPSESFYTVMGQPVRRSDLPTSGTAYYDGEVLGSVSSPFTRTNFSGDVELFATFGSNPTIEGELTNMDATSAWATELDGDYTIEQTAIAADGTYTTTLTHDVVCVPPSSCPSFTNTYLTGAFYDEGGSEVGGVLGMEGSFGNGDNFVVGGSFAGGNLGTK